MTLKYETVFFTAIAVILSIAAFQRNMAWTTEISFWQDVVNKSPVKSRSHNGLGTAYDNAERLDEAALEYRMSISLNPSFFMPYLNLCGVWLAKDRLDAALDACSIAVRLNAKDPVVFLYIGMIYVKKGLYLPAVNAYKEAIRINPLHAQARNNLGNLYLRMGIVDMAVKEFRAALEIDPGYAVAKMNLERAAALSK